MTTTRTKSNRRFTLATAAIGGAALGIALLPVPASAAAAATLNRGSGPLGTTLKVSGTCTDLLTGYATTVRIGLYYSNAFEFIAGKSVFHEVTVAGSAAGAFSGSLKIGPAVKYTPQAGGPASPGADVLRKPKAGDVLRVQVRCNQAWTAYPVSIQYGAKSFTVTKSKFTSKKRPAIAGKAKVGKKLTASKGTWSPKPTSYSYQWKRAGKAISKATKSTYTTKSKDKNKKITVTVKAKRSGYYTLSKTSKSRTIT